jgi:anti-sigma B factor antagonist
MHIATFERVDRSHFLALSGELDMCTAHEVAQVGLRSLKCDGCTRVVLDLMDVSFVDCAGIGALISLRNAARNAQLPLTILDPSKRVTKLLHLAGLESAFDIELTEGKAVVGAEPNRSN